MDRSKRRRKGISLFLLGTLSLVYMVVFSEPPLRGLIKVYSLLNRDHKDVDTQHLMQQCYMSDNFKLNHPDVLQDMYYFSNKSKLMTKCSSVGVR